MADKKVFVLNNDTVKASCIAAINRTETGAQIIITAGYDLRTILQNNLYWRHMGEIESATGESQSDAHKRLKRKFLHPIFMAGVTKANILYQLNYDSLVMVKKAGIDIDFESMLSKILTTTDATVKQMGQYIDAYWAQVNSEGTYLTDPQSFMEAQ